MVGRAVAAGMLFALYRIDLLFSAPSASPAPSAT
jgi:hypothetical protein